MLMIQTLNIFEKGTKTTTTGPNSSAKPKKGATLIEAESAAIGGVSMDVYIYYAKCIGSAISIITVVMYAFYTLSSVCKQKQTAD